MTPRTIKPALAILGTSVALMAAQSASAQVTVYQHCNYSGYGVALGTGSHSLSSLSRRGAKNDDISSVRVSPGYQATLYEHAGFRGRAVTLTGSTACLTNRRFNDLVSSIRVTRRSTPVRPTPPRPVGSRNENICKNMVRDRVAWNRSGNKRWSETNITGLCRGTVNPNRTVACFKQGIRRHGDWQRATRDCKGNASGYRPITTPTQPNRTAPSNSAVILYSDCNYRGNQTGLYNGNYDLNNLTGRGMQNDRTSSIFVRSGYVATVYEHAGFRGRSRTFTGNDSCFVNDGFNDMLSSIRVQRRRTTTPPRPNPGGNQSSEIRRLREENRRLKEEVETLKATIKTLLNN